MIKKTKKLRRGFSTGACAAAAAKAAFELLCGQRSLADKKVSLQLLNGETCSLILDDLFYVSEIETVAVIKKDAGDDPDVTNNIIIKTAVSAIDNPVVMPEDYLECIEGVKLFISGGTGIGKVTRAGLNVPVGKWAINDGPRKMIRQNMSGVFFNKYKNIKVVISAENGEKIAKKTLNPVLGIIGGISILGSSGRVEPYSNAAYVDTIKLHMRTLRAKKQKKVVIATGNRTLKEYAKQTASFIISDGIRIADFIAEALKAAEKNMFDEVCICCMPGKLYKYACGYENTHAHKNSLKTDLMLKICSTLMLEKSVVMNIAGSRTVKEMLDFIPETAKNKLYEILAQKALEYFKEWNTCSKLKIFLFSSEGKFIAKF